jgi:hypothetical protein
MASWYECKFKYNRENQEGGFTTVSETYLVDAVSFTEAETRVYGEIGANYVDFVLLKVAKYPVHELIQDEEGEKWYKCKVALITYDEKSEKEKKQKQTVIVNGNSVREAYERIEVAFKGSTSDYEILDIVTTGIIEVMPFVEEERRLRKLEPGTIVTNELVETASLSEN